MLLDIREKVIKDFNTLSLKALELIEIFESKSKFSPRITRCVVKLANGDIDKLNKYIRLAEEDWRDLINLAETV